MVKSVRSDRGEFLLVCIAVPALVKSVDGYKAIAEVNGKSRQVNIFFTPEVRTGDYVLLDNGYSTRILSVFEMLEILDLLEEISKSAGD